MRTLLLLLMIGYGTTSAWSQDNSPLTPDEGRQILGQLYELGSCREETDKYKDVMARDKELDAREQEQHLKELQLVQKEIGLKDREIELQKEQADTYKAMYEALLDKGVSFGCVVKKIFTLGIGRCK